MLDLPTAATRFFPRSPIAIATSGASTAFQVINASQSEIYYTFVATKDCYVKVGRPDMGAATTTDFLLLAGTQDFCLRPGEGVRVIRAAEDGVLQIGATS